MKRHVLLTAAVLFSPLLRADVTANAIQDLNQVTAYQKEMKAQAAQETPTCWDCLLKEKPLCSFADICKQLQPALNKSRLVEKKDGTYIPNMQMLKTNMQINMCRQAQAKYINEMPDAYKVLMKQYQDNNKKLYGLIQKHGDEKTWVAMTAAALDDPSTNTYSSTVKTSAENEATIAKIEKAAGRKLKAPVRAAYLEYLNSASGMVTAFPERVDPEEAVFGVYDLYTIMPPLTRDDVLKNQERYKNNMERIDKLFAQVQEKLIHVLDKKSTPENKEAIENLKKRIETIKLKAVYDSQTCAAPNAFYQPGSHSFLICPQMAMLPDQTLLPIIAHELGHSIDPCFAMFPLASGDISADAKPYDMFEKVDLTITTNVVPLRYATKDRDAKKAYYVNANGTDPQAPFKTLVAGINPDQYPFSKTIDCLSEGGSVKARTGSTERQIEAMRATLADLEASGGQGSDKAKELKERIQALESIKNAKATQVCSSAGSQMQEAFSDWVAGEVVAEDFPQDQTKAKSAMFETAGLHAAFGCHREPIQAEKEAFMKCLSFASQSDLMARYLDSHPYDSTRINKVYLQNPKIRNALKCAPDGGKYCE